MKKRFYIGIVIIVFILLITVLINSNSKPIVLIEDGQSISAITINGQKFVDEMIVNEMIDLLKQFDVVETDNPFPIETTKTDIEVDYTDNNKPKHIVLGSVDILYESADKDIYSIIDGEKLYLEIKKYLH